MPIDFRLKCLEHVIHAYLHVYAYYELNASCSADQMKSYQHAPRVGGYLCPQISLQDTSDRVRVGAYVAQRIPVAGVTVRVFGCHVTIGGASDT